MLWKNARFNVFTYTGLLSCKTNVKPIQTKTEKLFMYTRLPLWKYISAMPSATYVSIVVHVSQSRHVWNLSLAASRDTRCTQWQSLWLVANQWHYNSMCQILGQRNTPFVYTLPGGGKGGDGWSRAHVTVLRARTPRQTVTDSGKRWGGDGC